MMRENEISGAIVDAAVEVHRILGPKKQALTYMKLAGIRVGLLLNFGAALMKEGITRLANQCP